MRGVWVLLLSGCSLLTVQAPPVAPYNGPIDCVDNYVPPAIDTAAVVAAIAVIIDGIATPAPTVQPSCRLCVGVDHGTGLILFGLSGLLLEVPSAVVGYTRVTRCREAKQDQRIELGQAMTTASTSAHAGNCVDAALAMTRIDVISPAIHAAMLQSDSQLAACVATTARGPAPSAPQTPAR